MARDVKGDYLGTSKSAKLAKKYGIKGSHMGHPDGRSGKPNRSMQDVEKETAAAMANDYDVRRSIEAAQLAGNKKAQKLGSGISNIDEALAAEKFMKKTHKKRMGNGGEYASANDAGNVTKYWVNKDRNNLTDSMSANEQQSQAEKGTSEPYEPSEEITQAKARVEEFDNKDYGVYGNSEAGDNNDQRQKAAGSFLEKYKLDVKQAANFKPTI